MFLGAALTLIFASSATAAGPAVKLAMPGLRMVDLSAARGSFYSEHLALQLRRAGTEVLTEREIGALLGLERQRQLLGCTEDSTTCIAEIANAMGTEGVVLGDIARLGGSFQVNLKVISGRDGKVLAAFSERVSSEEETLDALSRGAKQLARELGVELPEEEPTASRSLARFWWGPVVAGAAGVAIGALLFVQADGRMAPVRNASPSSPILISEAQALSGQASSLQTGGAVALGLGLAFIATGAALAVVHFTRGVQVSFFFGPTGGAVALTGSWQ